MNLQFGAHPIYFELIGINLTTVFVAAAVLGIALFLKIRRKKTWLFELSFLLFLVAFTFVTLHGRLLQYIFPISLPEQPLIDNNLTFNYAVTNMLAYAIFPILVLLGWNRRVSAEELGLKVSNSKRTIVYIILGTIFASAIFLITDHFFHQQWIGGYTSDGLILWVLLVSIVSVCLQTLFFVGILFNRYIGKENILLLAIIALFAFQSYVAPNSLPWQACNMLTFSSKLYVTWKTKNVYGATLMSVATNLIELALQIL
jgi:hypothetical protein